MAQRNGTGEIDSEKQKICCSSSKKCNMNKKAKASDESRRLLLWVQIFFLKKRGCEEQIQSDSQSLADFVKNTQLYGIVGTVDDVSYGGLWHPAFDIELILGHISLAEQFGKASADCLIQFQIYAPPFPLGKDIIGCKSEKIVPVAVLLRYFVIG